MRVAMRCLIALNWIGFGVAANLWYMNEMAVHHYAWRQAQQEADTKFPGGITEDMPVGVKITNPEGFEFATQRFAEHRQRTEPMNRAARLGCGFAVLLSLVTALALMAIFPRLPKPAPKPDPQPAGE